MWEKIRLMFALTFLTAFLSFLAYGYFVIEPAKKGLPKTAPVQSKIQFNQPQQPLPLNGAGNSYFTNGIAPYVVKVADYYNHQPAGIYFIRSGHSINVELPLGSYEIRYASGKIWYGLQYLFGPVTTYNKADKKFDFINTGDQVSGYTVELYTQVNGNLRSSGISPNEW